MHGHHTLEVAEFAEELDMDLIQLHDAICDQVHVRERPGVSEAVNQLLLGVCDAVGDCKAETIPVVVGCLTELAERGIDPEDEQSYDSDEEDHVLRTNFAKKARSPRKSQLIAIFGCFRLENSARPWPVGRLKWPYLGLAASKHAARRLIESEIS